MTPPLERVRAAQRQIFELRRDLLAELHQISRTRPPRNGADEEPSAQAIADFQRPLAEAARAKHRTVLDALVASVEEDVSRLRRDADEARPKAGAAAPQLEWRWAQIRERLDGGQPLATVIRSAGDLDTLHAIAAYAPGWEEARSYAQHRAGGLQAAVAAEWKSPGTERLQRSLDDRMAQLVGGTAGAALAGARESEGHVAGFQKSATSVRVLLDPTVTNHDPLADALSAHYTAQTAGAGLPEGNEGEQGEPAAAGASTGGEAA